MSSATWQPSTGQWGMFGTHSGSNAGRIQRALKSELEGGASSRILPKSIGFHPYVSELGDQDIPGLGADKYFSQAGRTGWGGGPAKRKATPAAVRSQWYNPLKKHLVDDPLHGMKEIGGEKGEFQLYGGPTPTGEGLSALTERGLTSSADYLLPAEGNIEHKLAAAELAKQDAEDVWTEEHKQYDIDETREQKTFRTGRQEAARQRGLAAAGAAEEYEAGDILQGQTGMALSGPAREKSSMTESYKTMGDIAASEAKGRPGFLKNVADIESERGKSDFRWDEAKRQYHSDVGEAYDLADTALEETLKKLQGLTSFMRDPGSALFKGSETQGYLEDVSGPSMFDIRNADIPDYQTIMGQYGKAQDFTEIMKDYSFGLATGEDVPEVEGRGI